MNEVFIEKYKKLETLVAKINPENPTVFWLENTIEDVEIQNKLKLCRTIRNYLQHNGDKAFVSVTKEMCNFIDFVTKEVSKRTETAESKMKKARLNTNIFTNDNKVWDAFDCISKYGFAIITDDKKRLIGKIDATQIVALISEGSITKATKISKIQKSAISSVPGYMVLDEIKQGSYAVMDNETVLGLLVI